MNESSARTYRRLLVAAIASSLTILSWLQLPAVEAAELRAQGFSSTHDVAGDVPDCAGDITSATASWSGGIVTFVLDTACGLDTDNDPRWVVGATGLAFFIDVDRDDDPDYVVALSHEEPGVLYDAADAAVCSGVTRRPNPSRYFLQFASQCFPGPFRFAAVMVLDENPYGDDCTCAEDGSPDWSFSGTVFPDTPPPLHGTGYWMLGADGAVYAFGDADPYGAELLPGRTVDLEPTPSGQGYWIVNQAGNVRNHGDAKFFGHAGALRPFEVVNAISRTASGQGYWLFTNLGRVLPFGDASFFGDMSSVRLNGPVLDAIPTPSGRGYYMVGSDGGIFTFGDAQFQGSMGAVRLNAPVQSLVPDADGVGYWLVASDGGIFSFEAPFYGSMGHTRLNKPVTGMVGFGNGYLMVAEDGGIFTFGDAPFHGSLGDDPPDEPIVSTATLNQ
jgi:hypothetical protein